MVSIERSMLVLVLLVLVMRSFLQVVTSPTCLSMVEDEAKAEAGWQQPEVRSNTAQTDVFGEVSQSMHESCAAARTALPQPIKAASRAKDEADEARQCLARVSEAGSHPRCYAHPLLRPPTATPTHPPVQLAGALFRGPSLGSFPRLACRLRKRPGAGLRWLPPGRACLLCHWPRLGGHHGTNPSIHSLTKRQRPGSPACLGKCLIHHYQPTPPLPPSSSSSLPSPSQSV